MYVCIVCLCVRMEKNERETERQRERGKEGGREREGGREGERFHQRQGGASSAAKREPG